MNRTFSPSKSKPSEMKRFPIDKAGFVFLTNFLHQIFHLFYYILAISLHVKPKQIDGNTPHTNTRSDEKYFEQ